jgi:hypothetical protein
MYKNLNLSEKCDPFQNSCIYQIECKSIPKTYVGQIGRSFNVRYK